MSINTLTQLPNRVYESELFLNKATGHIRPGGTELTRRLVEFCGLQPGDRLLDVGCGTGASVAYLQRDFGLQAQGLDPSALLLERGRRLYPQITLRQGRGEELPYPNQSWKGILCECSLSLMELEVAGQEFYRVLYPGGWLMITDLYWRQPHRQSPGQVFPTRRSCVLQGARGMEDLLQHLQELGFALRLWEDCSQVLNQMVFDIIMEHGSLTAFWEKVLPADDPGLCQQTAVSGKPGYYLLAAQKKWGGERNVIGKNSGAGPARPLLQPDHGPSGPGSQR